MQAIDSRTGESIGVGDLVGCPSHREYWRVVGFDTDPIGRSCAVLEPVGMRGTWMKPLEDDGTIGGLWKVDTAS